jgi:hypothetical protein
MPEPGPGLAPSADRRDGGGYVAVITLGGRHFAFDSAAGEDLGIYEGEYVRQRCLRVMRRDTPLTVYFRPDVGLARLEVVVELGRLWLDGTGFEAAHITGPYSCEILYQGRSVAVVKVPYHWWFSRWRWQSAPRPVVREREVLLGKRLVAPYGRAGLYGAEATGQLVEWSGPMDTAAIYTAMGAGGDRPDIGLMTEFQADYLINGTSGALSSLLAQGEACGTMPIHWRDEHTGALVDVYEYPTVAASPEGKPALPTAPPPRVSGTRSVDRRYILYESSHSPAAAFLPFVLTDDPYFLEELEAQGTFPIAVSNWHRVRHHLPGLVYPGETRSFAWSMRSLFQLGMVAPERPPRWLKSRAYWRRCIADNLAYARLFMKSPARVHRIFRAFTRSDMVSGWQDSFVAVSLGVAVWMGYEEWREFYRWFCAGVTKLCDGQSGWNREWPTPYYYYPTRLEPRRPMTLIADTSLDAETADSWGEAWQGFKQENRIDDRGWDGYTLMQNQSGPTYYLYLRGSLALATHLDVPEARECYNYIASVLPAALRHFRAPGNCRWSIGPA